MRAISFILVAASLTGAMLAGCGSSSGGNNEQGTDASSDGARQPDGPATDSASPTPDGSTGDGGAGDSGDAACNFATFVIGLITNDTTGTAQPSTDLGQSCVDDQNQADFKSLFP